MRLDVLPGSAKGCLGSTCISLCAGKVVILFLSLCSSAEGDHIKLLMHTVSSFGICQGMSWQHLNPPWDWIGVLPLSKGH